MHGNQRGADGHQKRDDRGNARRRRAVHGQRQLQALDDRHRALARLRAGRHILNESPARGRPVKTLGTIGPTESQGRALTRIPPKHVIQSGRRHWLAPPSCQRRYNPVVKVREVLRQLHEDGWYEVRRRGSHRVMRHATKRGMVVVAGNPGADMRAGTLSQVLRQAGLTENTESGDGTN